MKFKTVKNYLVKVTEFLNSIRYLFYALFGLYLLSDILFINTTSDLRFLLILFMWLLLVFIYNMEEKYISILALSFIVLSPIFLMMNQNAISEDLGTWSYVFLFTVVLKEIFRYKRL